MSLKLHGIKDTSAECWKAYNGLLPTKFPANPQQLELHSIQVVVLPLH
ncbi:MAG TPA: hypothetical protein VMR37_05370 [Rhabdochlamydiaceae bacterium]|nr:hypothetical protein [Rhabdochlamydiaceae bacterium]